MALTIRLHETAGDSGIIDSLKELAYKVESIVDNNPDYACYYDGGKTTPELNVGGRDIFIGGKDSDDSVDSQIDQWVKDIQSDIDSGDLTEDGIDTSILLGIPYDGETKDYVAGEDMPTEEEWETTNRLFGEPKGYDPYNGVASVDFRTLDELRKWMGNH